MYDVVTIGSATQDVFLLTKEWKECQGGKCGASRGELIHLGSKHELAGIVFDTGGGATNAAVTFARAELRVATVTRVGNDPAGTEVQHALKRNGVDTRHVVVTSKESTGYSSILLTKNGERTVLVYRGASSDFHWNETPWNRIATKWLYLTSLAGDQEYTEKLMRYAVKKKIRVAWNPGKTELAWGAEKIMSYKNAVSILLLNREEAAAFTGQPVADAERIYSALAKSSLPYVVVTDGTHGATVVAPKRRWSGPRVGPLAKNATGAGDAFGSAFTAGMIKWNEPAMALRLGLFNSGRVVGCMGAKTCIMKKIPTLQELRRIKITER
jgi:sugar/nucleoside kinase (ribokinase family)